MCSCKDNASKNNLLHNSHVLSRVCVKPGEFDASAITEVTKGVADETKVVDPEAVGRGLGSDIGSEEEASTGVDWLVGLYPALSAGDSLCQLSLSNLFICINFCLWKKIPLAFPEFTAENVISIQILWRCIRG